MERKVQHQDWTDIKKLTGGNRVIQAWLRTCDKAMLKAFLDELPLLGPHKSTEVVHIIPSVLTCTNVDSDPPSTFRDMAGYGTWQINVTWQLGGRYHVTIGFTVSGAWNEDTDDTLYEFDANPTLFRGFRDLPDTLQPLGTCLLQGFQHWCRWHSLALDGGVRKSLAAMDDSAVQAFLDTCDWKDSGSGKERQAIAAFFVKSSVGWLE